jgi:hypothetical protein
MTLAVNGKTTAYGKAPGLIDEQPLDDLSIGEDVLSSVGDYPSPYPFLGKVEKVRVVTDEASKGSNGLQGASQPR